MLVNLISLALIMLRLDEKHYIFIINYLSEFK